MNAYFGSVESGWINIGPDLVTSAADWSEAMLVDLACDFVSSLTRFPCLGFASETSQTCNLHTSEFFKGSSSQIEGKNKKMKLQNHSIK